MKIDNQYTNTSESADILGAYREMEKYVFNWINWIYGIENYFNEWQMGNSTVKEVRDFINKTKNNSKLDANLEVMYNSMKFPALISSTKDDKNFLEDPNTVLFKRKSRYFFASDRVSIENQNMLFVDKHNDMKLGFSPSVVNYPISVVTFFKSRNDAEKFLLRMVHNSEALPGEPHLIHPDILQKVSNFVNNNISGKLPLPGVDFNGTYTAFIPFDIEERLYRDFLIDRPSLDKSYYLDNEDPKISIERKKELVEKYINSYTNGRLIYEFDAYTNRYRLGFKVGLSGSYEYDISKENTERVNGVDPILCSVIMNFTIRLTIPSIVHYKKSYNNLSGSVFNMNEINMILNRLDNISDIETKTYSGIFTKDFRIEENMAYLNNYLDNKIDYSNLGLLNEDSGWQKDVVIAAFRLIKNKGTTDSADTFLMGQDRFYNYLKNEVNTMDKYIPIGFKMLFSTTLDDTLIKEGKQLNVSSVIEFNMTNAKRIENINKNPISRKLKFKTGGTWYKIENIFSDSYKQEKYKLRENDKYIEELFLERYEDHNDLLFETVMYIDYFRSDNILPKQLYVLDHSTGDMYIKIHYPSACISLVTYLQIF